MKEILKLDHIQKYYGNGGNVTKAIQDISFSVQEGEFVGIMGASGSGKNTKLVQELEERNLLVKQADEKDKRVINLTLTEEGKEFVELRVTHFHGEWASRLPDLDDAVVDEFVHAITRMQETMPGIKGVKNNGKRK